VNLIGGFDRHSVETRERTHDEYFYDVFDDDTRGFSSLVIDVVEGRVIGSYIVLYK
jgi:hypothetical protein